MKERPILFSDPMVRAILNDCKTQTRRIWKMPKGMEWYHSGVCQGEYNGWICDIGGKGWWSVDEISCPYGNEGDRLWVRETWGTGTRPCPFEGWRDGIEYRADEFYLADDIEDLPLYSVNVPDDKCIDDYASNKWRPSIHMPRWASRIDLEITGVRVERLNEISEEDAIAEGIEWNPTMGAYNCGGAWRNNSVPIFRGLWESINGAGSWDLNPWVWVIEFKRVEKTN